MLPPLPPFPLLPSSFDEANKKFINQWRRGGTYFHFCRQQKRTSLWDNFSAKFSIVCIHCAIKKWLLITYTIYHNLIKCCNFEGLKNEAIFCLYFFNIYSTGLYFLLQVSQKGFAYNLWKLKISFWFEINNATEYRTLKRFWPLRRHLALRKAACAWQKWAVNLSSFGTLLCQSNRKAQPRR